MILKKGDFIKYTDQVYYVLTSPSQLSLSNDNKYFIASNENGINYLFRLFSEDGLYKVERDKHPFQENLERMIEAIEKAEKNL